MNTTTLGLPTLSRAAADAAPAAPVTAHAAPPDAVAAHPAADALSAAAERHRTGSDAVAQEQRAVMRRAQHRRVLARVLAPLLGALLALLVWQLISHSGDKQLPGPLAVWDSARELFADPFYSKGPNDQGIGWNVLSSLRRVGLGFGLAALVGIPLGFLIGRFHFLNQMLDPLISLLRPVSPLAWLPIGLMVFKAANPAAIWTIFICSIWPMVINTAVGVRQVPQDYLNVARVLNLSEWTVMRKILFPAVLPYMLTGVRLAVGTAWLVIVAAEMLTGGQGIGFWLWDEWNNLNVAHILIAIFVIGGVGVLLEALLVWIA
ncbi:MAG: nitrate ABC transporter permease, partial [Leptothrix sp. (in: b-proteobacteria)]